MALGLGIVLSSLVEPSATVTLLVGATSTGFAVLSSTMRGLGPAIPIFGLIVICCVGGLRCQVATQLFSPEQISRLNLNNRKRIVWGLIDEEPGLEDGKTWFALWTEAVQFDDGCDASCAHADRACAGPDSLEGLVLVAVKGSGFLGTYGDRVAWSGRLRHPPVARNPGALDYHQFLMHKGIHATLTVSKQEQVVSLERRDGAWVTESVASIATPSAC